MQSIDIPKLDPRACFGIELEGWFVARRKCDYSFYRQKAKALTVMQSVGLKTTLHSWANTYDAWHVTSELVDGAPMERVPEIISPIIADDEQVKEVKRAFVALRAANLTADNTCGLHVHVSPKDGWSERFSQARVEQAFKANWDYYCSLTAYRRLARDQMLCPATSLHDKTESFTKTVEYKGRGAPTYDQPTTLPYIIGMANFTLAAAEDAKVRLEDFVPPKLRPNEISRRQFFFLAKPASSPTAA